MKTSYLNILLIVLIIMMVCDIRSQTLSKQVFPSSKNQTESSIASGVYVYKLQAGDFINFKKMILLKLPATLILDSCVRRNDSLMAYTKPKKEIHLSHHFSKATAYLIQL